jgi:peptidoglycan LD-endopeptidase LytH
MYGSEYNKVMADIAAAARRVIIVIYLLVLHGALVWLLADKYLLQNMLVAYWSPGAVSAPQIEPHVTPTTLPSVSPSPNPEPTATPVEQPIQSARGRLLMPVQGVKPEQLIDTYSQSRSEGRVHEAIDIMAPAGTPVVAVADGEILRFHDSVQGGITIYQISTDKRYFYYYAHLQARAPGIAEKQFVKQGTTIGYVGDTGNAGPGNNHLHFSIKAVVDPNRFWDGTNINPYPILKGETSLP